MDDVDDTCWSASTWMMLTSATTNQSQCDPSTTNTSSSSLSNQPTGLCLVFFNARCTIHTIFQSLEAQCAPYIPGSESIPASKSFTLKQRFTFKSKSQLRWYAIARCAIRTTFQEVNPFRHQSLWNNNPLLRRHRSEAQVAAYSGKWSIPASKSLKQRFTKKLRYPKGE